MGVRRTLAAALPGGDFTRAVATVASGTAAGQAIVILSAPILTRLFAPADYGVYAVATSVLSILLTVTCLRYEYAIPLPESDVTAANLLGLALVLNLLISFAAGVVLWLGGSAILGLFGAASIAPYTWIISLGQLGGGVAGALSSWAVRTKTFADIAAMRLVQAVTLVVLQVGLGLLRFGALGLLLGDAAGRVGGSTRLARAAWSTHADAFRQVSVVGMAAVARRYRRFPIFSSGSALLATLGLQAPVLLLAGFYGTDAGGRYALAARICAIPVVLIANAVGQVFVAEASRRARTDASAVRSFLGETTWSLARIGIVPALVGMVAAPLLAPPVFGPAWREVGLYIAILIPSYFVEFVTGATGDLLYVLERQDLHLAREVFRFGLIGGAIPAAAALGYSEIGAVVLVSLAGLLTYTIYGLITWWAAARHRVRLEAEPGLDAS